ncbi:MAG: tRNA 2-thiouridine(34) synthase MnmA [Clostridiales bacterium]|nr:tRNA 2-thiouridine(34) synthase MnmA [Clostridiales bacterium]
MGEKIMVGLSGGVDSAVTALKLKEAGYQVAGVTLLLKPQGFESEINDAKAVAKKIEIPHFVVDLRESFKKNVIEYFVDEYTHARTPNPCIMCNKTIKFGEMLSFALSEGYDKIATGHYAKINFDESTNRWQLLKSSSPKDQSYFLFEMSQEQLKHSYFPLEAEDKKDTRLIAEQYALPVAQKHDSQEICFIPDKDYVKFIKEFLPQYKVEKGRFIDKNGNTLGTHQGIINYTIGQRKGLGIAFGKPMYVTKINSEENTVTLEEEGGQLSSRLIAENLNMISVEKLESGRSYQVKIRCQAKPANATVSLIDENTFEAVFDEPQRSITPGQAAVIYDGNMVIGGGTIK